LSVENINHPKIMHTILINLLIEILITQII